MDLFKQCLKEAAATFIMICCFLLVRLIIPLALAITPVILAATLLNWFWLFLYVPFGYIGCLLTVYLAKKGYSNG